MKKVAIPLKKYKKNKTKNTTWSHSMVNQEVETALKRTGSNWQKLQRATRLDVWTLRLPIAPLRNNATWVDFSCDSKLRKSIAGILAHYAKLTIHQRHVDDWLERFKAGKWMHRTKAKNLFYRWECCTITSQILSFSKSQNRPQTE